MKNISFFALSLLLTHAPYTLSQGTTTLEVIEGPQSTQTLAQHQATQTPVSASHSHSTSQASQSTLATSTTPSPSSSLSSTSVVQATRTENGYSTTGSAAPADYSSSPPGGGVDVEGGASGSDSGSFSLSQGGMIAIIVVVVCVAVFGIASIVLFVLAKRRQWNIRASIKRASRRLTGRGGNVNQRDPREQRKRSGVIAGSKPALTALPQRGHKRGTVVEVKDVEKGAVDSKGTDSAKSKESGWLQRLRGNEWQ